MPVSPPQSPNSDTYTWIGASGAAWGVAVDWSDTTASLSPAPYVPGTLTAALITDGASIVGGGNAASVTATGSVSLAGIYSFGGTLQIGVGTAPYGYPIVTTGTLGLAAGSQVAATSLILVGGGLSDVGSLVSISGSVAIGFAGTPPPNYSPAVSGLVTISAGGTVSVTGSISDAAGLLVASGTGSKLIVGGTLTGGIGSSYSTGSVYATGNVAAVSGGFAQLGGAVFNGPPPGTPGATDVGLLVDSTSTIEIGTTGGAAAGAVTVDAGRSMSFNANAYLSGTLVNNGVITVGGGSVNHAGSLSGSGTVDIGANAIWEQSGNALSGTFAFLGASGSLQIDSLSSASPGSGASAVNSIIMGFQPGDDILLSKQPATSAVYTAGSGGAPGTLVIGNNGVAVETLKLAGNFAGETFFVSPTATGASISVLTPMAATGEAVSTSGDAFSWIGQSGGAWGSAGNWSDTTSGSTPAVSVPGGQTAVTIIGSTNTAFDVILGGGAAGSIGTAGSVDLSGSYDIASGLTIGQAVSAVGSTGQTTSA